MVGTPRIPFFIIETGTDKDSWRPFYTVIDQTRNAEFAELKKQEASRSLPAPQNGGGGRITRNRAEIHAGPDMLIESYTDEPGGPERKKFRDEVIVAQADERGRIYIPKETPELARKILREVRVLNPRACLDPGGAMLPEEMPEEDRPRNLGGRPRKQTF